MIKILWDADTLVTLPRPGRTVSSPPLPLSRGTAEPSSCGPHQAMPGSQRRELTRNRTPKVPSVHGMMWPSFAWGSPRTCRSSQQHPQASASWEVESPGFWGAEDEEKSVSAILTFHWGCILELPNHCSVHSTPRDSGSLESGYSENQWRELKLLGSHELRELFSPFTFSDNNDWFFRYWLSVLAGVYFCIYSQTHSFLSSF